MRVLNQILLGCRFFQHFSLYRYCFLKDPVVITKDQKVTIQTARTQPLVDAYTAEELELIQVTNGWTPDIGSVAASEI